MRPRHYSPTNDMATEAHSDGNKCQNMPMLKESKLKQEIAKHERPWYKRSSTYINAAVATSTLVGVLGQTSCRSPESDRTLLTAAEARQEVKQARHEMQYASNEVVYARDRLQSAQKKHATTLKELHERIESRPRASQELKKVLEQSIRSHIYYIVSAQLGVSMEILSDETSFINDLGADSLDTIEIVMELEDEFDMSISNEEALKIQTVGAAIDYVMNVALSKSQG